MGRGVPAQSLGKLGPVMDQHGSQMHQLGIELRQGVEQVRVILCVPENPGFMLIGPGIGRQSLGIPGPQLAQSPVHKPPSGSGALPDEHQILRGEEHGVVDPAQRRAAGSGNPVDTELAPPSPEELCPNPEFPVPGLHRGGQRSGLIPKPDHLPVIPGPEGFAAGEVIYRLQQIRLSLGVLAEDHVAAAVKVRCQGGVVAERHQLQPVNPHRTPYSAPPGSTHRLRDGSSCPA